MLRGCFRRFVRLFRPGPRTSDLSVLPVLPDSPAQLLEAWRKARGRESLGFLLAQARQSRGLSFVQLQTVTGICAAHLERLERDCVPRPPLYQLLQLAETLELDRDELVERLGDYEKRELVELERRWRSRLTLQPGNRTGLLMLDLIERVSRK